MYLLFFKSVYTGVLVDTEGFASVNFFKLFFMPDIVFKLMTEQSNLYGEQRLSNITESSAKSIFNEPRHITRAEMQAYVALQIAMGICCKPELSDYWRKYWLTRVSFGDVMSRQRYQLITAFLHFNDNIKMKARGEEGYDPLYKVRRLLDIMDPLYMNYYCPQKDLSIDESMVKFKGRVFFGQFLPAKPIRFGIKQFCLSEAKTVYALKFLVCTGRTTFTELETNSDFSVTEQVVLHLMADETLQGKGHVVYTDSFYTSPKLCRELKEKGIEHCGTVGQGRKNMPKHLHPGPSNLKLRKGDPVFMKCADTDIVSCGWHDTKYVCFILFVHNDNTINKSMKSARHEGDIVSWKSPS